MLPEKLLPIPGEQIAQAKLVHGNDLRQGYDSVFMMFALERKYPGASCVQTPSGKGGHVGMFRALLQKKCHMWL